MTTAATTTALAGAATTSLLVAGALAYLRGVPERAPGLSAWAAAFTAVAAGFGLQLLEPLAGAAPTAAGTGALHFLAAALLFSGTRSFLGEATRLPWLVALGALVVLAVGTVLALDVPARWIAGPSQIVAGLLVGCSGFEFAHAQPTQPRSGQRVASGALVLLGLYFVLAGWLGPLPHAETGVVLMGQLAVLAVAIGLAFVAQDAVQQRLRLAERRLHHALEALDQGFALYDADDRLVMANSAYRRMFPRISGVLEPGASYEELLRASADAGQYLEAAGRESEWVAERLAHHRSGEHSIEQQLADGRWIYLLERRTPAGEWASLRVDITDIKRRERELAESESRYRDLIEGSIQGIMIHHDWSLLFANRAAARMLGFARVPELLGQGNLRALLAEHEVERLAHYRELRRAGDEAPEHYEVDMRCRDGSTITVDCVVRRIRWRGQTVTQATLIDITERKRAERELHDYQHRLEELVSARTAELQAANEELEAFTYSVSHDLRAPLRRIRGFADALVEDSRHRLDGESMEYLERLRRSAEHMERLISDLLELSRLSCAEIVTEQVDLTALAAEIADGLREESSGRRSRFDIEPGLLARGDPRLLRIVLDNLLGNAWKYTAREEETHIAVRSGRGGDGVRYYEVVDNGVGFDMQYSERLFGPFQRLHADTEFDGVGVGLATVARIVRRHGGRVWAEGEVGRGAAFRFTLGRIQEW